MVIQVIGYQVLEVSQIAMLTCLGDDLDYPFQFGKCSDHSGVAELQESIDTSQQFAHLAWKLKIYYLQVFHI